MVNHKYWTFSCLARSAECRSLPYIRGGVKALHELLVKIWARWWLIMMGTQNELHNDYKGGAFLNRKRPIPIINLHKIYNNCPVMCSALTRQPHAKQETQDYTRQFLNAIPADIPVSEKVQRCRVPQTDKRTGLRGEWGCRAGSANRKSAGPCPPSVKVCPTAAGQVSCSHSLCLAECLLFVSRKIKRSTILLYRCSRRTFHQAGRASGTLSRPVVFH